MALTADLSLADRSTRGACPYQFGLMPLVRPNSRGQRHSDIYTVFTVRYDLGNDVAKTAIRSCHLDNVAKFTSNCDRDFVNSLLRIRLPTRYQDAFPSRNLRGRGR